MFRYLPLGSENTLPSKNFDSIHNAAKAVVDEARQEKNPNKYSLVDAEVNVLFEKIKMDFQNLVVQG